MNLFQIKTKPHGIERLKQFLEDGFICIGWPGIGNLSGASKDEIRDRLAQTYNYTGHELGNRLGHVNAFVNTMDKGDYVIIRDNEIAYIGVIDDYIYEQRYDNDVDGMCHRRDVVWMDKVIIVKEQENDIQNLIKNRNTISKYPKSFNELDLDKILDKNKDYNSANTKKLDSLFDEALLILEQELKSQDPDRRLKAATELMRLRNN